MNSFHASAVHWQSYRSIHDFFPKVRKEELDQMLTYVNPKRGENIVEFSSGSGFLTMPLAQAVQHQKEGKNDEIIEPVDSNGKIITYDAVLPNSAYVHGLAMEWSLPIVTKCFSFCSPYIYSFEEEDDSVDKIVSLASFHHCDVHKTPYNDQDTGIIGRQSIFREAARMLIPGGRLIIGDIIESTTAQRYFDAVQAPLFYYPTGHPHEFLHFDQVLQLCQDSGLTLISYKIEKTPWSFADKDEAVFFLHRLHNAQCSLEELEKIISESLFFEKTTAGISLDWELGFLVAEKKF